jgi:cobalt-zinc-cadmium efflux system membrane fusion protein
MVLASIAACEKPAPVEPKGPEAPPDEVWLTPKQVQEAKVEVQPVEVHDLDDTVLTSGTVTLDDLKTGHVYSPVTGRVIEVAAQLGQSVHKGDPLAVIESPDIGNAVSDVHKAEADMIAAEHDLRRKKALYEQKAGPASDLEASEDNHRRVKAELERAHQKEYLLRVGSFDTVTQRYTLPAPVDGQILARSINPGIEVQGQYSGGANVELFTIGELGRIWVLADVYEMDLPRVHVGTPAIVRVAAYPDRVFAGTVDWVSGSIDPGNPSAGVVSTRATKVRLVFDNPDELLRPMMYATVEISVEQKKALAIPRNALFRLAESKVVFVDTTETGGLVHFKRVLVDVDEGESSPWLEVKKGLDAGQKIAVNGAVLFLP